MFDRIRENPVISPDKNIEWEALAAFNPSVVKSDGTYHLLYRALSSEKEHEGASMNVSSIGYSAGTDPIHFNHKRQIIWPEEDWEKYGCEDPRVTFIDGKYYIFYTALSSFPFTANSIHIGLAVTSDFRNFEKHQVTRFNSKAMSLFPEKIDGKFAALLTVHTDLPPAKIALAFFDKEEDIWSEKYWQNWYAELDKHVIPLLRDAGDHLEVGAQPLKTEEGWLVIYSYIHNYFSDKKIFAVEAVLLDSKDPAKVKGHTPNPLILPEKEYELHGYMPNITFPSGALIENDKLYIYYGAADTVGCLAIGNLKQLLCEILPPKENCYVDSKYIRQSFKRYLHNPIIAPRPEFAWEAKATFNAAVIYEDNKFHFIYRAMSMDDTSVFGYASSRDGVHIDERLHFPVYEPRGNFEKKLRRGNSGCEDPRITKLGNELYMFYTAYDGYTPRVAFTSISVDDFLKKNWIWKNPQVISPPNVADKDACLLGKKIDGKYVIFHRAYDCICINMENDLEFGSQKWLVHHASIIEPRKTYWDNSKFGIAAPPIETPYGWLMFYHRATIPDGVYKVEAALLKLDDPATILAQSDATLLEPEMEYEEKGIVPNVVFPCGAVLVNETLYLYYGAADKVLGLAKMELNDLLIRFGICVRSNYSFLPTKK